MAGRWIAPFLYFMLFDPNSYIKVNYNEFKIIWSVPFQTCQKKISKNMAVLLTEAGIAVNSDSQFQGDQISTFYTLGLYPHIGPKGSVNGGIPQLSNLTEHLLKVNEDIQYVIPNVNFSGLALIDWEAWRPTWDFNFGSLRIYQKESLQLVWEKHPDWPLANLTIEATRQWEQSAREIMEETIELAKSLRPKAKWCFYGFPDCYNYYGTDTPESFFCKGEIVHGNDGLQWLWQKSSANCPSIYIRKQQLDKYNITQRSWYTSARLHESIRVSNWNSDIYPYMNYYVFDGGITVYKEDFQRLLGQSAALGLGGVVIWGASRNVQSKSDCLILLHYIEDVIAPSVKTLIRNLRSCKRVICGGKGICVWPKRSYEAWRILFDEKPHFDRKDINCIYKPD